MRRIVVTGTGLVTPLGCGTDRVWERLLAGRSGIRRLADRLVDNVPAKIAGIVPDATEDSEGGFDPAKMVMSKELVRADRFIQMAVKASDEAIAQASWKTASERDSHRTATIIGSGIGGFATMKNAVQTVDQRGPHRLSPFTVPSFLVNLAAGHISIRHHFKGPAGAPVTACAASLQAIGDGARMICAGEADVAICGGAESCIERVSLGSFAAARALSTRHNDEPEKASRPFDVDRDGFVMSEGASAIVIEALDHALARGATPLAEILSYATTSDAFHIAAAPPDGPQLQTCMRLALDAAGLTPDRIDYIHAHATATQLGDAVELAAIRNVFGAAGPAISSTKSSTGHMLGAAGGTAAIFTIKALQSGMLPPTLNLDRADPAFSESDLIGTKPRSSDARHAMVNAFAFGGVNACLIVKRWES